MSDIKVINRQNQLINLLVKSPSGAIETRPLLPRQSIELPASSLSEQVFDLNRRGHVALAQASAKKALKKAAPVALKAEEKAKYEGPANKPYKAPTVAKPSTKV